MEKYPNYSVLMSIYKNDKEEFVKDAIDSMRKNIPLFLQLSAW